MTTSKDIIEGIISAVEVVIEKNSSGGLTVSSIKQGLKDIIPGLIERLEVMRLHKPIINNSVSEIDALRKSADDINFRCLCNEVIGFMRRTNQDADEIMTDLRLAAEISEGSINRKKASIVDE